jgi:hypothetical protein
MAKYRENDIVILNRGVLSGSAVLAVVLTVLTLPVNAGVVTADVAMRYRVRGTTGQELDVDGTQISAKATGQPVYKTATNFLADYADALEAHDEVFFTLPDQIVVPGTTTRIDVVSNRREVLFRGDDRPGDVVFAEGFYERAEVFSPSFKTRQGDVDSTTGTCASGRPEVGCLFPLIDGRRAGAVDPVRLYVFAPTRFYRTYLAQQAILDYKPALLGRQSVRQRLALNAWSREVIVPGLLPGADVLGYYRVYRRWLGATYDKGMYFKVDPQFVVNTKCAVPATDKSRFVSEAADAIMPFTAKERWIGIRNQSNENPAGEWYLSD